MLSARLTRRSQPTVLMTAKRTSAVAMAGALTLLGAGCGNAAPKASASTSTIVKKAPTSAASASVTVLEASDATHGTYLTTTSGYALYTYTADLPGGSGCLGKCLVYWPPLVLPAGQSQPVAGQGVSDLGTTNRDGRLQVTYKGLPLYTFITDKSPGQITGQNSVDSHGTWILASPTPTATPSSDTTSTSASSAKAASATSEPSTQTPSTQTPSTAAPTTQTSSTPAPTTQLQAPSPSVTTAPVAHHTSPTPQPSSVPSGLPSY